MSGSKRFVVLKTPWHECILAGVPFLSQPGDSLTVIDPTDYLGPNCDRGALETDVIMNPHRAPLLSRVWSKFPEHVILYETENLISATGWRMASERVRQRCPRNEWWNYSAANSAVFGDTPKPLRIPLGQTAAPAGAKVVDVAFVGSMNQRRMDLLDGLRRAGATVAVHAAQHRGLFGAELAAFEGQARVVLNVHYYAPGVFESFRVVPATARGARVVSEFSIDGEGAEFCARVAGYQNLKNAVLEELERK
jgi:hypothetical protein